MSTGDTLDDAYIPIPVEAAQRIAEEYEKSIVIVAAWDAKHGQLHTTTYGVSADEKHYAADGGHIVAKALGADVSRKITFEDFRTAPMNMLETSEPAARR